jgi:GTP-sensing pleiotropic transcriptional regulator CodY
MILIQNLDQHYKYLFYLFKYNIQINIMVKYILTHKNIPSEYYKNYESYYKTHNMIPIN